MAFCSALLWNILEKLPMAGNSNCNIQIPDIQVRTKGGAARCRLRLYYISGTEFLYSQNPGSCVGYHTFPAIFKCHILNGFVCI